jgi:uncharacterized membrane protein
MQPDTAPNVRWGEWISEGWQMFAERWQVWVTQMLILFVVFAIPIVPIYAISISAQIAAAQTGQPPEPPAMLIPVIFVAAPLLLLGVAFLWAGLWRTALKQLRGEPIAVKDLFSGGDIFLRVVGAILALAFLGMLGAILCIFPAFIVAGLFYFTLPLIVDRNMDISSALSASYEATKKNWFMFTLFAFVVSLLASLGQFACYVGLLVSYPLQFTISAIAYRDTFGVPGARRFGPGSLSTPTSYAGQSWPASAQTPPPPQPFFASPPPVQPQSEHEQQQPANQCPQCGAALTRTANFCNFCGARLQT